MCESKVFVATHEGEQIVLEDVTAIKPEGDGYRLTDLFGKQVHVRGRIKEIDLLKHRIVLEPAP
jgi:predicted RNA-binding protein